MWHGYLLMIAVSTKIISNKVYDVSLNDTYLGIVTPAFSQACIKAEPAVAIIKSSPFLLRLQVHIPSIDTFFPSMTLVNMTPLELTQIYVPTVSSTSARLEGVEQKARETLSLACFPTRAADLEICVRSIIDKEGGQKKRKRFVTERMCKVLHSVLTFTPSPQVRQVPRACL